MLRTYDPSPSSSPSSSSSLSSRFVIPTRPFDVMVSILNTCPQPHDAPQVGLNYTFPPPSDFSTQFLSPVPFSSSRVSPSVSLLSQHQSQLPDTGSNATAAATPVTTSSSDTRHKFFVYCSTRRAEALRRRQAELQGLGEAESRLELLVARNADHLKMLFHRKRELQKQLVGKTLAKGVYRAVLQSVGWDVVPCHPVPDLLFIITENLT